MKKLAALSFILTAFIAVRGQNNYSTNTVGFCLLDLPSNQTALVANQFNTPNNLISTLLGSAPAGSAFCKSPSGWPLSVSGPSGWSIDMTLNPGEAGFLTPSAPMHITFSGSVPQGYLTNLLPQGISAVSSMAPISGLLSNQMGFPSYPGDAVGLYSSNDLSYYQFNSSWLPQDPYLTAGQGFLFMNYNAFVTNQILGTLRNDYTGWFGMQFTVGSWPLTVSRLGRMMTPGNSGNHTVKLLSTNGVDIANGTTSVSMARGTPGQFQYASLSSPITLQAGQAYWIVSQETQGGDQWYDSNTTIVTTTDASDNAVVSRGSGDWNTQAYTNHCFVPVSFQYIPLQPPVAPVAISPNTTGQSSTPYYTFYIVPGAESYTIFLWDYANSTSTVFGPLTPAQVDFGTPGQGRFLQPTSLYVGTYTWVVSASNEVGTSPWSDYMTFTVGAVLDAPVPISPDTSGQSSTPYYTFYTVPEATTYNLFLWKYATLTGTNYGPLTAAQVDFGTPGQGRFLQPTALDPGTYTWEVSASNEVGTSPWSDCMTFIVGDVPPAPIPISPNTPGQSQTPYYTFNTVPGATSYAIFLWDYATETSTVYGPLTPQQVDFGTPGQGRFLQPGPLAYGTYTWVVSASNEVGTSPWSDFMNFIVGSVPDAPVPISPGSQGVPPDGQSPTPYYTFNTVPGATSYTIFLWDYATETSTVYDPLTPPQVDFGTPGQGMFLQPTALDDGTYTWVVSASNGAGTSPWSVYMSFVVGDAQQAPFQLGLDTTGQSLTRYITVPGAGLGIAYGDPVLTRIYAAAQAALENLTGVRTIGRASPLPPGLQPWSDQPVIQVGAGPSSPTMNLGLQEQMQNQNQGRTWVQNISTQPYPDSGTVGLTITPSGNTFSVNISGAPSGNTYYIMSNPVLGCTNTGWTFETAITGNSSASISASNRATLFLVAAKQQADSDSDGIQDWWLMHYFGHPTGQGSDLSRATDDADGDGVSNFQESILGTNPTQRALQDDGTINLQVYTAFK